MTTTRAAMCLFAAISIFLGGYGIRALQAPRSSASAPELEQRIAMLEHRLAATEPLPASATGSVQSTTPATSSGDPASQLAGNASPLGRRPIPTQELARLRQARIAELDASFRQEPADPAAARLAETKLADAASSDDLVESGITPSAIDTQCRARSCRVIARFPAGADAEGWASLFVLGAGSTLAKAQAVVTPGADGALELAIYGTRN